MTYATQRQSQIATETPIAYTETDLFTLTLPPVTPMGKFTLCYSATVGSLTNYTLQAYVIDPVDGTTRYRLYTSGAKTGSDNVAVELAAAGAKQIVVTAKSSGTTTSSTITAKALVQIPSS